MQINTQRFYIFLILIIIFQTFSHSQRRRLRKSKPKSPEVLKEVVVKSNRIDVPFSKSSRAIILITEKDIENNPATDIASILQQYAGVDIRRRGTRGMQADLYIRGGSFDQTLLLIDGIKVEDPQTGHHTLNIALPLEVIKRIEIVKGPSARVFGQNAFTGAINIVTKDSINSKLKGIVQTGSYSQRRVQLLSNINIKNINNIVYGDFNSSDGYRENTDFENANYFIKNSIPIDSINSLNILSSFSERKFGANGFYASPSATQQYEETQASLLAFTTKFQKKKWVFKPKLYWRRHQDLYLFNRQNPPAYRNLHISNKIGFETNMTYSSKLGITGLGFEAANVSIVSNNLGDHNRFISNVFLEHKFSFFDKKLDLTPGVAVSYFTDFGINAFPGIDLGYFLNDKVRFYGNIGYTYRVPTYTDLYYSDPTTIGNENLNPESAFSYEIGSNYHFHNFNFELGLFQRNATNIIDYIKETATDEWEATNIRELNTSGVEINSQYVLFFKGTENYFRLGYTFLDDSLKDINFISRYSINSLKHHATFSWRSKGFFKNVSHAIIYKLADRASDSPYAVVDFSLDWNLKNISIFIQSNNIFNREYTETNLVPMPTKDVLFGIRMKI